MFVGVGSGGTVLLSENAETWALPSTGDTTQLHGVCYSPQLKLLVAVGETGRIRTSPDGVTWTTRTSGVTQGLRDVAWSPTLGLFCAVGGNSTVLTSPDGIVWTTRSTGFFSEPLNGVVWAGGTINRFVIVGTTGSVSAARAYQSADGISWSTFLTGIAGNALGFVTYSSALGMIVSGGSGTILTATSVTSWTARTSPTSGTAPAGSVWQAAAVSGSMMVLVGTGQGAFSTPRLCSSPDGVTWTLRSPAVVSTSLNGAAWSLNLARFVAVGSVGRSARSTNGTAWTANANVTGTPTINGVCWAAFNVPPFAPTLTGPADGSTIDRTITQRFAWVHNDPDNVPPGTDPQSRYQLRYRPVGTGTWTTVSGTTPNQFRDFAANTFANATTYEWQVRTYDQADEDSPWSTIWSFTAATPPAAPTPTSPTSGGTITTQHVPVTWSTPTQDAVQVQRVADNAGAIDPGTIYEDSGALDQPARRSYPLEWPVNSRWEWIRIRIRVSGLWSLWAAIRVQVSYVPPAIPTVTVTPGDGTISVQANHPTPEGDEPTVVAMNIWRRTADDSPTEDPQTPKGAGRRLVEGYSLAPSATYVDRSGAAGIVYEYRVEAVGSNGVASLSVWTG